MRTRIAQPGAVTWNQKGKIWARCLLYQPGGRYFYAPFCKWQRETALGIILSQLLIICGGPFQATCYLCSTYVYLYFQLFAFANDVFHFCGAPVDPHSAFLRYRRRCGQLGNYGSLGASARYVRCGDCIFCAVLEKIWELYIYIWMFFGDVYKGAPR